MRSLLDKGGGWIGEQRRGSHCQREEMEGSRGLRQEGERESKGHRGQQEEREDRGHRGQQGER